MRSPVGVPAAPTWKTTQAKAHPFLVAAVGASAGGLEALSGLLRGMPGDAPLALVIVQHLARHQKSILPELLAKVTALRVSAAKDEQKLEPGHVYVIPPDARMTVIDGHLRVRPSPAAGEPAEGTVDSLFRSVASEYKERAIGVVLSGAAHDGAAGINEIKGAGGITIAQEPEEATVNSMPLAAIATGGIDATLPVDEIGRELVRLAQHPLFAGTVDSETPASVNGSELVEIFQLLRKTTGIDFSSYKLPTLKRRIERRMALLRVQDLGAYLVVLRRNSEEVERLQAELLIHVTSFFREPVSFAALQEHVVPRLLRDRDDDAPIRIWVPGCSTGEEVYSLAMVVFESLNADSRAVRLQIFGTDVSEATLNWARAGTYPTAIANEVSAARLRRFFAKGDGGGYRINQAIRDCCVFARQDVTRDPPFSRLDLIVCRNLLIYLNQATQHKVLEIFHYALCPEGILMLGGSETLGGRASLFTTVSKKPQLYQKRAEAAGKRPVLDSSSTRGHLAAFPRALRSAPPARAPARNADWDPQNEANRVLLDRYSPPAVIVDADLRIVRSLGGTGPYLELPSGNATLEVLKMIRPELAVALRAALREAGTRGGPTSKESLPFKFEGRKRVVDLRVVPLDVGLSAQFLVLFEERSRVHAAKNGAGEQRGNTRGKNGRGSGRPAAKQTVDELNEARRQTQAIIDDLGVANDELQSANEEVLSSNEELQSTNEELDTAKEELQSTNEELRTLNDELRARNDELTVANSDLANLLASVQIAIVMVTRELRIRRITPTAEKVMNIIPSDVGRPIGHLKPAFACPDLEALITEAIDTVTVREREVEGTNGKKFALQIRPYQTIDNRIDGAVIVLFDVSAIHDKSAALEVAQATGEALMSTMHDPILLLSGEGIVQKANAAFYKAFGVERAETEGRFVYELGDRQWDIPDLRRLLDEVLPDRKNFDGFAVEHTFARVGRKKLLLDARRIESGQQRQGVILLVIREVGGNGA